MWALLIAAWLATAAAAAAPGGLGCAPPAKPARPWPLNAPASRALGDAISAPFTIPAVPFTAAGTTAGFTDDYDEACPYGGSTAADVVYRYVAPAEQWLTIDLCGSAYDTKVYVYDADLNVVACNDDYYFDSACGLYVSRLAGVALRPDTYYVVIDGYGAEFGEYQLAVSLFEPCLLESCGGDTEDEPPLADGYVDHHNGGCNSVPAVFGQYGPPLHHIYDCLDGTSGWYDVADQPHRDTDWFTFDDIVTGHVTFTLDAEQPTYLFVLGPHDCDEVAVLASAVAGPCSPASLTVTVDPHASCWLWVGPTIFEPPAGFDGHEYRWQLAWTVYDSFLPVPVALQDREQPDARIAYGWNRIGPDHLGAFADDHDAASACGGAATPGGDGMLAYHLAAGETLEITNWWLAIPRGEEPGEEITYLLLTDLRATDDACVGLHETLNTASHTFAFTAEHPGWHYLVVDVAEAATDPEVRFTTRHPASPPPPPPVHDSCAGALELPTGPFIVPDDLSTATNDFDPGADGTYGPGRTGRDVVYRFAVGPGGRLDVTMTGDGDWDEELYVVGDCDHPEASVLALGVPDDQGGVVLSFAAPAPGTFWLVCDSFGIGPRSFELTGMLDDATDAPSEPRSPRTGGLVLEPCRPNPFNPRTTIAFTLSAARSCRLDVFSLAGRRVATLIEGVRDAGRHEITWDGVDERGRPLAAGAYVCRLQAGGEAASRRLLLVR